MHRITLEPTFILHRRAFSNTSLILECFTLNHGRVPMLAKSARGPASRYRGRLEPFTPILASWSGLRDLKTLGAVDYPETPLHLKETALACGFYLNELLMRLLEREDPQTTLFACYHDTLSTLSAGAPSEASVALRLFEKQLLEELGYGIPLIQTYDTQTPIHTDAWYAYLPERGFRCLSHTTPPPADHITTFSGDSLIALHQHQLTTQTQRQDAKRLLKQALRVHLGEQPLMSRQLLI